MLPVGDDDSWRRSVPLVTYALIALNVAVFFAGLSGVGSIVTASDNGGVAFMAHVGGFVAGILLTFLLRGRPSAQLTA